MTVSDAERLQRELFLRAAFPEASGNANARLVDALRVKQYAPGELLFMRGQASEVLHMIVEGRVTLESEGEAAWFCGPRSAVGAFDAVLERPHARQCRALEPCFVFELKAALWHDALDDDPDVARAVVRDMASQLCERFQVLRASASGSPPREVSQANASLSLYEKIVALRSAALLARAGLEAVAALAEAATEVRLAPGQTVFEHGQARQLIQIVVAGAVELRQTSEATHRHGVGEVVGGAAALCRRLSKYSATSLVPTTLLCIDEQEFFDRAEDHPQLSHGTLAFLVSEIERLNWLYYRNTELDLEFA